MKVQEVPGKPQEVPGFELGEHIPELKKEIIDGFLMLPPRLSETELNVIVLMCKLQTPATTPMLRYWMGVDFVKRFASIVAERNKVSQEEIDRILKAEISTEKRIKIFRWSLSVGLPAYETVDSALQTLEKAGIASNRSKKSKRGDKDYEVQWWYINPHFLQLWMQKKSDVLMELSKIKDVQLRKQLYPDKTLRFLGITV